MEACQPQELKGPSNRDNLDGLGIVISEASAVAHGSSQKVLAVDSLPLPAHFLCSVFSARQEKLVCAGESSLQAATFDTVSSYQDRC